MTARSCLPESESKIYQYQLARELAESTFRLNSYHRSTDIRRAYQKSGSKLSISTSSDFGISDYQLSTANYQHLSVIDDQNLSTAAFSWGSEDDQIGTSPQSSPHLTAFICLQLDLGPGRVSHVCLAPSPIYGSRTFRRPECREAATLRECQPTVCRLCDHGRDC